MWAVIQPTTGAGSSTRRLPPNPVPRRASRACGITSSATSSVTSSTRFRRVRGGAAAAVGVCFHAAGRAMDDTKQLRTPMPFVSTAAAEKPFRRKVITLLFDLGRGSRKRSRSPSFLPSFCNTCPSRDSIRSAITAYYSNLAVLAGRRGRGGNWSRSTSTFPGPDRRQGVREEDAWRLVADQRNLVDPILLAEGDRGPDEKSPARASARGPRGEVVPPPASLDRLMLPEAPPSRRRPWRSLRREPGAGGRGLPRGRCGDGSSCRPSGPSAPS